MRADQVSTTRTGAPITRRGSSSGDASSGEKATRKQKADKASKPNKTSPAITLVPTGLPPLGIDGGFGPFI